MRIVIAYEDVADPIGGAPVGIQHLAAALATSHQVSLWGRARVDAVTAPDGVSLRTYRSDAGLLRDLRIWLRSDRPDVVIIVGFFLRTNAPLAVALQRNHVPVVLVPMGQLLDSTFSGRVFSHSCNVVDLETRDRNIDGTIARLTGALSPGVKTVYRHVAGTPLLRATTAIGVMSEFERRQIESATGRTSGFIPFPWGIDHDTIAPEPINNFYADDRDANGEPDDRPVFVLWARLDWHWKGLDRLLAGVAAAAKCSAPERPPFRVVLSGPDYRGGADEALAHIARHDLGHSVRVLLPGDYPPRTKTPLRDADACVLLSRWDGSPRTLREAAHFGTPMIVSEPTNFADLVESADAGIVVRSPDDPAAVASALLRMTESARARRHAAGATRLGVQLGWDRLADDLAVALGPICAETAGAYR